MKRTIIALLLSAVLIFLGGACGQATKATVQEPAYVVGLISHERFTDFMRETFVCADVRGADSSEYILTRRDEVAWFIRTNREMITEEAYPLSLIHLFKSTEKSVSSRYSWTEVPIGMAHERGETGYMLNKYGHSTYVVIYVEEGFLGIVPGSTETFELTPERACSVSWVWFP